MSQLKVYGAWDPMTDDWLVAFRMEGDTTHRGIVVEDRVQYQPPTDKNARPTLRLSRSEVEALAAHLSANGLTPKPADDLSPTKAHLADALAVRDRLLALVEKR